MEKNVKTTTVKDKAVKEIAKNEIMVNDVKVELVSVSGLDAITNKEINVNIPNAWIFGATVQGGDVIVHFDLIGKENQQGYDQQIKFWNILPKEITKIFKGSLNDTYDYIALQATNYKNGVASGYKTMSYSILDKKGNYLFTHLQSASAVSVIGRLLNLTTNRQADNVYKKTVGRNGNATRSKTVVPLAVNDSFKW